MIDIQILEKKKHENGLCKSCTSHEKKKFNVELLFLMDFHPAKIYSHILGSKLTERFFHLLLMAKFYFNDQIRQGSQRKTHLEKKIYKRESI